VRPRVFGWKKVTFFVASNVLIGYNKSEDPYKDQRFRLLAVKQLHLS